MAIRIIKKAAAPAVESLEPLVPRPVTAPVEQGATSAPSSQNQPSARHPFLAWEDRKIASSLAELDANRDTMRPPEPRACSFCGRGYAFPCDGADDRCMNARFVRQHNAQV